MARVPLVAIAAALLAAASISTGAQAQAASDARGLEGLSALGTLCTPTSVAFFDDIATVTGTKIAMGGQILYRQGGGAWQVSPIRLRGPHSLAKLPDGRLLINDTDNHRLVQVDDLTGKNEISRDTLAGVKLSRPHDQMVDPVSGDIYVVDGGRNLFRFKSLDGPAEVWTFEPSQLHYDRALSWFDGKLHIVHSSRGEVIRIDDFGQRAFTVFKSPRPQNGPTRSSTPWRDFPAGALTATGLVLNDVEKFDGWYYGTNFFAPSYAGGADTRPGRLIRWRTWDDFAQGRWEDLSARLPPGSKSPVAPYFLTVHDGGLYVTYFDPEDLCGAGGVIRLD